MTLIATPNNTRRPDSDESIAAIALVQGEKLTQLPHDLYIPPDALEVILEAFEGPLDLLLYLIKKHDLDILDIPIATITQQYVEYIELMKIMRLELAAEYLVMAALLAEIKSRTLLPRPHEDITEEDPRAELIRRLQAYEQIKQAAESLGEMPREGRDFFQAQVSLANCAPEPTPPQVNLKELLFAFKEVMKRVDLHRSHTVKRESLSVRERMSIIITKLQQQDFIEFTQLFNPAEGRAGVVVSFIAILELVKQSVVSLVQSAPFQPIHIKAAST